LKGREELEGKRGSEREERDLGVREKQKELHESGENARKGKEECKDLEVEREGRWINGREEGKGRSERGSETWCLGQEQKKRQKSGENARNRQEGCKDLERGWEKGDEGKRGREERKRARGSEI
jgi:hypothetical protein